MSSNERAGGSQLPSWWLDKALPAIRKTSITSTQLARLAGEHGAPSWDSATISKFVDGRSRPAALVRALSRVLHIPQPFFVATSEAMAIEMTLVAAAAGAQSGSGVDVDDRAGVIDAAVDREFATTVVDSSSEGAVPLEVYGKVKHADGANRPRARRPQTKPA